MQTNAFPEGRLGKIAKSRARTPAMMLCAPLLLFHAACTAPKPAASPQAGGAVPARYVVTAETTPFYKYGPLQPAGPDLSLKKGQLVTMVGRHYGYSRVIDPDGDSGYIPTDDIAPAPDQSPALASSSKKSHGGVPPGYEQPNDVPLPSKQSPSDDPAPSFRY